MCFWHRLSAAYIGFGIPRGRGRVTGKERGEEGGSRAKRENLESDFKRLVENGRLRARPPSSRNIIHFFEEFYPGNLME